MINTHPSMLDELLSSINESPNVLKSLQQAYADVSYLRYYMELAVSDQWTSIDILDVIIKDYNYHRSMAGAFLLNRQTHNIISNVIMNPDAKDSTKVVQFRALSEMLYSVEAEILKHILLKKLPEFYPNLTHQILVASLEPSA